MNPDDYDEREREFDKMIWDTEKYFYDHPELDSPAEKLERQSTRIEEQCREYEAEQRRYRKEALELAGVEDATDLKNELKRTFTLGYILVRTNEYYESNGLVYLEVAGSDNFLRKVSYTVRNEIKKGRYIKIVEFPSNPDVIRLLFKILLDKLAEYRVVLEHSSNFFRPEVVGAIDAFLLSQGITDAVNLAVEGK
jgi:hypothetical protein